MTMSDRAWTSSDESIEFRTPVLVRLSLRRWRRDFSPRTARALARPAPEADAEVAESEGSLLATLTSSLALAGDGSVCSLCGRSSSFTQFAGVGGTGPNAAIPLGAGRLVGGEMTASPFSPALLALCEREEAGGGPGGGGGSCMPIDWSQRTWEDDLDLGDIGVVTAGVDVARLAPGGMVSEELESEGSGICTVSGVC